MKTVIICLAGVLMAVAAFADPILVQPGWSQAELEALAASTGARPGRFPALVDKATGMWVPVGEGGLPAAGEALAALVSGFAQDTKTQAQKSLENEYLDLVDAIYAKAGDPAPPLEAAKDLGKARAKVAKAREAKQGTGQGHKKTADDALEFVDDQQSLLALDLQLRDFDPNWRKHLSRHDLE